eukprot:PITA_22785
MWVKGFLLQFIIDSGSQKNLILEEVMKRLGLLTTTHPQSYTIGWIHQGQDLRVSQQHRLPYNIKPFTDERHVVYESRPRVVIVTLGNKLYRIPEVAPPTSISLVTTKQCNKLISKTKKFVLLMICPQEKKNKVATTSRQGPSARQPQMDKVLEEYEDIFTSTAGFPLHYQVKHSIDLTLGSPLPNGPIDQRSVLKKNEIKK